MIQQNDVKNEVNFHEFKKFKFDDERILIENAFNSEEIYLTIVEFN